jgi:site-specific DNA recombinase
MRDLRPKTRDGWQVLDGFIFRDEAISGSRSDRDGFNRMLETAKRKPRPFDVLLVDDTSRFARDLPYALTQTELLNFLGIEIHFVAQGISSKSEQFRMMMSMHGIMDEQYVKSLSQKTQRGLIGTAERGNHTGGRCFGYRSVPIESQDKLDAYGRPTIVGARLAVDEAQAKIVRKIYEMYASGLSIKSVAKRLNVDGVRSPQPRAGRQQSWAPSSVRVLLRNERYRGCVVYGKTRKIRNPETKKNLRRVRESEFVRMEKPEQRIVPEKLWRAVQERIEYVNRVYGAAGRKGGLMNSRAASSPYVFSGLLRCGVCGANFTLVGGAGRNHKTARYGCPSYAFRGTCTNAPSVRRDTLEADLLAKLQRDVLSDAAIDYCLEQLEQEIAKRTRQLDSDLLGIQKRKATLEKELSNFQRMCADGFDSQTIREGITTREREIRELVTKVAGRKKGSVHEQVTGLRKFVRESLVDIRELLTAKHNNTAILKRELARHIDAITLLPNGKRDIQYKGQWKLLGKSVRDTGGAEGQS